jgi:hypothetical protein
MRLTRDVLGAVVLGLAAASVASAANNQATEHLSTSGSLTFAAGRLTEGATVPPTLELSHGYELLEDLDSATTDGGSVDTDVYASARSRSRRTRQWWIAPPVTSAPRWLWTGSTSPPPP